MAAIETSILKTTAPIDTYMVHTLVHTFTLPTYAMYSTPGRKETFLAHEPADLAAATLLDTYLVRARSSYVGHH